MNDKNELAIRIYTCLVPFSFTRTLFNYDDVSNNVTLRNIDSSLGFFL